MKNTSIPIVGLPLAMESMEDNGVAPFVADLLAGRDIDVAFERIRDSKAAQDSTSYVIKEYVKWSIYGAVKRKNVVDILGFSLDL